MRKPIYRAGGGNCLKQGIGQLADLRGGLSKKRAFERGTQVHK